MLGASSIFLDTWHLGWIRAPEWKQSSRSVPTKVKLRQTPPVRRGSLGFSCASIPDGWNMTVQQAGCCDTDLWEILWYYWFEENSAIVFVAKLLHLVWSSWSLDLNMKVVDEEWICIWIVAW